MVYSIADILNQWEGIGVFEIIFPFLLIFAVVFGILTATNILGHNKGVHLIIAFVIGFLALRSGMVQSFFAEVFPRLGVGLAVIMTLVVLIGLFIAKEEQRFWLWGLGAIAFGIFIVVITKSFEGFGWGYTGFLTEEYVGWVFLAIVFIGLIIAVAASGGGKGQQGKALHEGATFGPWWGVKPGS